MSKKQVRICLRCGDPFLSKSPAHRICCKTLAETAQVLTPTFDFPVLSMRAVNGGRRLNKLVGSGRE